MFIIVTVNAAAPRSVYALGTLWYERPSLFMSLIVVNGNVRKSKITKCTHAGPVIGCSASRNIIFLWTRRALYWCVLYEAERCISRVAQGLIARGEKRIALSAALTVLNDSSHHKGTGWCPFNIGVIEFRNLYAQKARRQMQMRGESEFWLQRRSLGIWEVRDTKD